MKIKGLRQILIMSRFVFYGLFLQAVLCTVLMASDSNAQRKSIDEIYVNVDLNDVSLKKALSILEEKTSFEFFFDKSVVDGNMKINASASSLSLGDLLRDISLKTELKFKRVNESIYISRKEDLDERVEETITDSDNAVQQVKISGKVTASEDGEPLPGVSILIKGTASGTTTDIDGNYSLEASEGSILQFSYIGFITQEVTITNQTTLNITMQPDLEQLEEVVVVGYGTQKKSDLTSAISSVKGEDIVQRITPRLDEALQGQMAGVSVQQGSGVPGAAPKIRVRGINSITGGNSPLYVIDGLPIEDNSSLGNLNMNDVESIEVLKDAASASIYGSRGANGVVLITTKRGKGGKPTFQYNAFYGWQNAEQLLDFMDGNAAGQMYAQARNEFWVAEGGNANDPNSIRPATRRVDPIWTSGQQPTYDIQDDIFETASIQNHSISLAGGNDKTTYFASLDYLDQEGIAKRTGFERFSARLNLESKVSDKVKLGINFSPSYSEQVDLSTEGKDNTLNAMLRHSQLVPLEYYRLPGPNGRATNDYGVEFAGAVDGPGSRSLWFENADNRTARLQLLGNSFLEVEIIDGLKFRSSLGVTLNASDFNGFLDLDAGQGRGWGITTEIRNSWQVNWLTENTLNYAKNIDKHSFTGLIGYTTQKNRFELDYIQGRGHANDLALTLNNAGRIQDFRANASEWSLISYLARVTYSYDDRYAFTSSVRRDGSSRFGFNTKWGIFPSVSAAWNVANESFFPIKDFMSTLKLRLSWGETGNNAIGNYASISRLRSVSTPFNGQLTAGILPSNIGDDNLGWETTVATNFGIDFGFLNDRFNLTAELYRNITSDLLLGVPVPAVTGFFTATQNIGEVENRGFEIELQTNNTVGDFKWSTNINIAHNKNVVLKMGPDGSPIITGGFFAGGSQVSYTGIGQPIGTFYMLVQDGIYQNQQELDAGPVWDDTQTIGSIKIKDVNGDGVLNLDDRDFVGNPFPDWNFGITNTFQYKNFDLSIFINGALGHETYFMTGRYYDITGLNPNVLGAHTANWENRFISENQPGDGKTPKAFTGSTTDGRSLFSTRWLHDSSWWRVKNLTLGYTLPSNMLSKIKLRSLRLYVTGDNLYLNTDYPGYNPEGVNSFAGQSDTSSAGYDYGVYPLSRRWVFGLNASF